MWTEIEHICTFVKLLSNSVFLFYFSISYLNDEPLIYRSTIQWALINFHHDEISLWRRYKHGGNKWCQVYTLVLIVDLSLTTAITGKISCRRLPSNKHKWDNKHMQPERKEKKKQRETKCIFLRNIKSKIQSKQNKMNALKTR